MTKWLTLSLYWYKGVSQVVQWLKKKKKSTCWCRRCKRFRFDPWVGKIPWSRKWQPTPVFLHGRVHGQRSLAGSSPRSHKQLDTTEHTHTHARTQSVLKSYLPFYPNFNGSLNPYFIWLILYGNTAHRRHLVNVSVVVLLRKKSIFSAHTTQANLGFP